MKPSVSNHAPLMRLFLSYFDRIIKQMRRFERINLSIHDLPIRKVLRNGDDGDFNSEEFFLDKVIYIDDASFTIEVTGMTDNPDNYTFETIEAARIERVLGAERHFYICRYIFFREPPYIDLLSLFQIMRLLERTAQLFDNERQAVNMQPFHKDESEMQQLLNDLERQARKILDSGEDHPFLNTNWLS